MGPLHLFFPRSLYIVPTFQVSLFLSCLLLFLYNNLHTVINISSNVGWVSRTGLTCIFSACPDTPTITQSQNFSHSTFKFNQNTRVAIFRIELLSTPVCLYISPLVCFGKEIILILSYLILSYLILSYQS